MRRGEEGGRRWGGGEGGVEKEEGGRRRERRKEREGGKGTGSLCWCELEEYIRSHHDVQERALLSKLDNLLRGWILLSTYLPFSFFGVTGDLVELVTKWNIGVNKQNVSGLCYQDKRLQVKGRNKQTEKKLNRYN